MIPRNTIIEKVGNSDGNNPDINNQEISTISAAITTLPHQNNIENSLSSIDDLKFFLETAPVNWQDNQVIRRYYLNSDLGFVSCVRWNKLFYITGTDIVKACLYKMQNFGRIVTQNKKFEEGIFSDLRNLKCGVDSILEQPKSAFLAFLFKNLCLKTQKKQKVFFWFSVPHDKLFLDALERDLKRESLSQLSSTKAVSQLALSFHYDLSPSKPLHKQINEYFQNIRKSKNPTNLPSKPEDLIYIKKSNSNDKEIPNNVIENSCTEINNEKQNNNIDIQTLPPFPRQNNTNRINKLSKTDDNIVQELNNNNPVVYETSIIPEIKQQKLIVDQDHSLQDQSDIEPIHNTITNNLLNSKVDNLEDEDFPLDYFPISIEYPNQPIMPQTDFQTQFSNVPASLLHAQIGPLNSQHMYDAMSKSMSSNTTISAQNSSNNIDLEDDPIPINLNNKYQYPIPYNNMAMNPNTPAVMTNRKYYETSKNRSGQSLHLKNTSSSSLEHNSRTKKPNEVTNGSDNGSHQFVRLGQENNSLLEKRKEEEGEEDQEEDDIQYEIQPQVTQLPPHPQQGSYGNQLYSGFFYPLPYNTGSQEFINHDSQNYFPEDYLPYNDPHDGNPQYGSIHDFQAQQYGQIPYHTCSSLGQPWNALPPEALQPAQSLPPEALKPAQPLPQVTMSAQKFHFTPVPNASGSNIAYGLANQQTWGQNISPFGSRATSATVKNFPISVFSGLNSTSSTSFIPQQMGMQAVPPQMPFVIKKQRPLPTSQSSSNTRKSFNGDGNNTHINNYRVSKPQDTRSNKHYNKSRK